jgi:hypothetical protein
MLTTEEKLLKKKEHAKRWYLLNREKTIARAAQWKKDNPEQFKKSNLKSTLKYHQKNKAKVRNDTNKWRRNKNQKYRNIALQHYGHKCSCCNENRNEFLCFDHINGDGAKHRKEINGKYLGMGHWLVKNNFPDGFQCLCHNCNLAKGFYGYCPHELESGKITQQQADEQRNRTITRGHSKKID